MRRHVPLRLPLLLAAALAWSMPCLDSRAQPELDDLDPPVPDTETAAAGPAMDPEQAAAGFRVPPGFRVSVYASEPTVRNPIAMTWDANGRLWIAENYTYAERGVRLETSLRDRVVVFEDLDGDGRPDSRRVFTDSVQNLTGVEVGDNGVWLICPPRLLFIPDADRDAVPDGPAVVVLDGFHVPTENHHNFANGLKFGPDGWLYGRCGASAPGSIGVPGAPESERVPLGGGIWRYHTRRKVFEALAQGTTNPWGHDWDARGEAFFINTVNGHLWHVIPGSHLVRPHTIDPNPHVYESIDQHADHYHWDNSKDWSDSRSAMGEHDLRGGGHAHSGMIIYLGDQWPDEWRGKLLTLNLHGRRANVERLERVGSGFVGRHEPDTLKAADPWFRGIELAYGPDGAVYVLDWSDTGECHENTGVHRNSGRIYRVSHGGADRFDAAAADLSRAAPARLAELHAHPNEWYPRQARRELLARARVGQPWRAAVSPLRAALDDPDRDVVQRLRALWTLHALDSVPPARLVELLDEPDEALRVWAIRLLTDREPIDDLLSRRASQSCELPDALLAKFAAMAATDASGLVRLALASTLQRLPADRRAPIAAALMTRAEDADDHNLSHMVWYGLIPLGESAPETLVALFRDSKWPRVRAWIARRLADRPDPTPALAALLAEPIPDAAAPDLVRGVWEGLRGRRKVDAPEGWAAFAVRLLDSRTQAAEIEARARELSVIFGDGRALDDVKRLALDAKADLATRRAALETLIETNAPDLREVCEALLRVRFLNTTAARGLARFDDPALGRRMAESFNAFHPSERPELIEALTSRPAFAEPLLDLIAEGRVPRDQISAFQARRILSFDRPEISEKLARAWGDVRDSEGDKRELVAAWRAKLDDERMASADLSRGRVQYDKLCASCHTLYGVGGDIGPDLTGSGRHDLDYLLENILDPAAVVTRDYRMTVLETRDGRVLNGIVRNRNDRAVTLRTPTETLVIPAEDIEAERVSDQSLMPEALLAPLSEDEVRDLFAYLRHPAQVPLPPDLEAAPAP